MTLTFQQSSDSGEHEDTCWVCRGFGTVIKCDTCVRVFHGICLEPPLARVPDDEWICPRCQVVKVLAVLKRVLFGVWWCLSWTR